MAAVAAFPRRALGLSEAAIRSAMQRPHDACHGAGAVLAAFLDHTVQQADQLCSHDAGPLGEAGLSILDAALTDRAPNNNPPHVLVAQARAYIRRHLVVPGLNIESVAGHHHVSVRTLQRAFAADGQTVTELIRTLRLHALRQDLADPPLRSYVNPSAIPHGVIGPPTAQPPTPEPTTRPFHDSAGRNTPTRDGSSDDSSITGN